MPLDDETKAEVAALFDEKIKTFGTEVKGLIASGLKGIDIGGAVKEAVKTELEAQKPEPEPDPKKTDGDAGDPKVAARIADLERKHKEAEERAAAAEAKQKEDRLLATARDALRDAGVERVDHALAVLHHQKGLLRYDDQDRPGVFTDHGDWDEVQPMAKAIEAWIDTDEGKSFLPARNVQGTGTGAGDRNPVTRGGKIDMDNLGAKIARGIASIPGS